MYLENFEKITSIPELAILIYKLLELDDQLRLACVTHELGSVFRNLIWKEQYRNLKVHVKVPYFVILNETDVNRRDVKLHELQLFLHLYADDVEELTIKVFRGIAHIDEFFNITQFRYITNLRYDNLMIPMEHLKLVANHCTNLQKLSLLQCARDYNIDVFIPDVLMKLRNLRQLTLECMPSFKLHYSQFQKMATHTKLEYLKLTAVLIPDQSCTFPSTYSTTLKHLYIQYSPLATREWYNDVAFQLKDFETLLELSIKNFKAVTDDALAEFSKECKYLEKLALQCTKFDQLNSFSLPSNVTELCLTGCKGLTYENMKQILTQLKLRKFQSEDTLYMGVFEDFRISPYIQSLNVDAVPTKDFKLAYDGNANLRELTWHQPWLDSCIVSGNPLESCTNLEQLEVKGCQIRLLALLQLKHLRELIMPHPVPFLKWSYITALLKHPSLRELTIKTYSGVNYKPLDSPIPTEGFSTNVHNVLLPLDIFDGALDLWLNLSEQNSCLRIKFSTFAQHEDFEKVVRNLLIHRNFPASRKTINICGFATDCRKLRKRLYVHMDKLRKIADKTLYGELTNSNE